MSCGTRALAQRMLPVQPVTFLQGLRLGDAQWLSTPCDFSGGLALSLKAAATEHRLATVVTSFNDDYVGYVIPAKYYALDGCEPRTMSFFGSQRPGFLVELLHARA